MTSTIITPRRSRVSVSVPPSYVGKQVAVTFSLIDEPKPVERLSDKFRGVFTKEDAESFNKHVKAMREEWNDI